MADYGADTRAQYATPAGAIHVSTTGNDATGTGTLAAPYRTITKAVAAAAPGSTVAVRGGSYHEGGNYPTHVSGAVFVPVEKPGITIQNYNGEEVWLDGSSPLSGFTPYATGQWRAPFARAADRTRNQVRGSSSSSYGTYLLAEYPIAHWPELLFIDGVRQTQVQTIAEVGPGKFFVQGSYPNSSGTDQFSFLSTHYVIGVDPAGKSIRVGDISRCITNAADDTTIRGIGVRRYPGSLSDLGVVYSNQRKNITLENVTVEDTSCTAVDLNGAGWAVKHCTFLRSGMMAIASGNNADGGLLEWSYFEKTNLHRFNYGPIGGNIKIGRQWDTTIRFNRMHDTRGHAIWADECVYRARIYGNLLTDTYGIGILHEISGRSWIVDNIIINNGVLSTDATGRLPHNCPAIDIKASSNTYVWNNTIIKPEVGIRFSEGYRKPLNDDGVSWRTTSQWGPVFGQDKSRTDAFYQAEGFEDVWDFYRKEMTWNDTGTSFANNVFAGTAGLNSGQSAFIALYCETGLKGAVDLVGQLHGPNVYVRIDGVTPQRFANSIKHVPGVAASPTVVHFNMTGAGHDGSPSWNTTMDDAGSLLTSGPVTVGNDGILNRRGVLATAPLAPVPAEVQALRDQSPFRLGGVGAGDPGDPPPPIYSVSLRMGARPMLIA